MYGSVEKEEAQTSKRYCTLPSCRRTSNGTNEIIPHVPLPSLHVGPPATESSARVKEQCRTWVFHEAGRYSTTPRCLGENSDE